MKQNFVNQFASRHIAKYLIWFQSCQNTFLNETTFRKSIDSWQVTWAQRKKKWKRVESTIQQLLHFVIKKDILCQTASEGKKDGGGWGYSTKNHAHIQVTRLASFDYISIFTKLVPTNLAACKMNKLELGATVLVSPNIHNLLHVV